MTQKQSAGVLIYRLTPSGVEVLLVHPGGPFWARKDAGAWSIPKGEFGTGEEPLAAAQRELKEETGLVLDGPFQALAPVKQKGGKVVQAFAVEDDCDPALIRSNDFSMEWPPKSGRMQNFPEVDRAAWYGLDEARGKILPSQTLLLDSLEALLAKK